RIELVGPVDARVELRAELVEPGAREDPLAGALEPLEAAEPLEFCGADRRVDRGCEVSALEALHPPGIGMARRRRVEHAAAAHGRLRAEDHAVAASRDDRLGEPELVVAVAYTCHACDRPGRAVMDLEARGKRAGRRERDVEP